MLKKVLVVLWFIVNFIKKILTGACSICSVFVIMGAFLFEA